MNTQELSHELIQAIKDMRNPKNEFLGLSINHDRSQPLCFSIFEPDRWLPHFPTMEKIVYGNNYNWEEFNNRHPHRFLVFFDDQNEIASMYGNYTYETSDNSMVALQLNWKKPVNN